jgi:hypothetical protein
MFMIVSNTVVMMRAPSGLPRTKTTRPSFADGRFHDKAALPQPLRLGSGRANAIAPGKRPLSSMAATLVEKATPADRARWVCA